MNIKKIIIIGISLIVSCTLYSQKNTTINPKNNFSDKALMQSIQDTLGRKITIKHILDKYKGKVVVIDIWASWCKDCLENLPKIKQFQEKTKEKEFIFLFLSLDKKESSWLTSIKKHNIKGEHYWFNTEWKNDFTDYIELNWIPRYMVVNKEGKISVYYAINILDPRILVAL